MWKFATQLGKTELDEVDKPVHIEALTSHRREAKEKNARRIKANKCTLTMNNYSDKQK